MEANDLEGRLQNMEVLVNEQQIKITELENSLQCIRTKLELEKLKVLHEQRVYYEHQIREEKERSDSWIKIMSKSSRGMEELQKMIQMLSAELMSVKCHRDNTVSESTYWLGLG